MLSGLLLALSLVPTLQVHMNCSDGGEHPANAQTQPLHGPGGASVILRISSSDDHSKESHECMAHYQLVISPANGSESEVDLNASDGDYGRRLSAHVDGFSEDGKLILGVLDEGPDPLTLLFVYESTSQPVKLIDLREAFASLLPKSCPASFRVAGTRGPREIVLSLGPGNCASGGNWILNLDNNHVSRLSDGTSFQKLYPIPGAQ